MSISPKILQTSNMEEAISMLLAIGPGTDIAELCGGQARATTLAIRRSLRAGPNFDLIAGVNLNNQRSVSHEAIHRHTPRISGSDGTHLWTIRSNGQIRQICHS